MDLIRKISTTFAKVIAVCVIAAACSSEVNAAIRLAGKDGKRPVVEIEPELNMKDLDHGNRFHNLEHGLRVEVASDVSADEIVRLFDRKPKAMEKAPIYLSTIEPADFVRESLNKYIRDMGIIMYANASTDLVLKIIVAQFDVMEMTGGAKAMLYYELLDANGNILIPRQTVSGNDKTNMAKYDKVLGKSCARALSAIDWGAIAYHLKGRNANQAQAVAKVDTNPAQAATKQVVGEGDTTLEQTIIRWYIVSTPQGADVTWRVISSAPDVKNTNGNYVGTTPYESTESFDIKGMSYQNSANVQIEVQCEKAGYLAQKKRFNLRQALDQKEISAKFNLVKED